MNLTFEYDNLIEEKKEKVLFTKEVHEEKSAAVEQNLNSASREETAKEKFYHFIKECIKEISSRS